MGGIREGGREEGREGGREGGEGRGGEGSLTGWRASVINNKMFDISKTLHSCLHV